MTRFALEKALKLSEVLMQEIGRLDRLVKQQQKYINQIEGDSPAVLNPEEEENDENFDC